MSNDGFVNDEVKISIVATLYHSAPYLAEFYERASAVARQIAGDAYEIVLVNDGSPDAGLEEAIKLTEGDHHVVVIDLSRNFGHHQAMMSGLSFARGEKVFLVDSDLEEEPEWAIEFDGVMTREHCDVVYGVQAQRKGGCVEQWTGRLFYQAFRRLTQIDQPDNIVTARLMTRRYVDALLLHAEREINIGGLWIITGFKQQRQLVNKHSSSPTTYSLSRKLAHLVNAVTSFSSFPLVLTFYSGLLVSLSAIVYIAYLVLKFFFVASLPSGYTSLIASVWLFSGLIILFIGVQGIYVAKIFSEVKQRPRVIVRDVYGNSGRCRGGQ